MMEVGDGGETLGVDGGEAESRPPDVKVEHCDGLESEKEKGGSAQTKHARTRDAKEASAYVSRGLLRIKVGIPSLLKTSSPSPPGPRY